MMWHKRGVECGMNYGYVSDQVWPWGQAGWCVMGRDMIVAFERADITNVKFIGVR